MPTKKKARKSAPLEAPILAILARAAKGRGKHAFLTAYQIFAELDDGEAKALIQKYGPVGTHGGKYFGGAGLVATAGRSLERRQKVEIVFLDTRGMRIDIPVQGELVKPSGVLGLYRLKK